MTSAPTKLPSTSSGAGHRVRGGDEAKHTQSIPGGYTPSTVGPRMSALLANIPTQQTGAPTHRGDYTATRTTAAISAPVDDIEDSEFSDVSETEDTGFSPLEAEPQVPFMRLITGKQAGEMLLARFPEKPGIYAAREYLESQFGPPLTLTYLTALLYMAYRDYGRTMSEPSRQTAARMRDVLREVDPEKGIGRSEIARKLGIDQLLHQNSLGRHIDELVRSGLVTRTTENKRIIIRPLPKLHEVSDIGSERTLREITTAVREWKKNHDRRPSIMEIRQQLTMPEKMKANRFNLLVKACIDARYGLTRHDSRATRKDVTARASKYTNAIHEEMRRAPGNALSGSAIALYLTEKNCSIRGRRSPSGTSRA